MLRITLAVCVLGAPLVTYADVIDFETLPGGAGTVDMQEISDQYASLGVTFSVVDPITGEFVCYPRIAKVGPPRTAFEGCEDEDTPLPGQSVGASFLTNLEPGYPPEGDLLVTYLNPVNAASGVILDVDCRDAGGPPCEQFTITAEDSTGLVLATQVIDGPPGAENPECLSPHTGPGDGVAFSWSFDVSPLTIHRIRIQYTGAVSTPGLAFDNFSPASLDADLSVTKQCPVGQVGLGEEFTYTTVVSNSGPGDATNVLLKDGLPAGTDFVSAIPTQGSCTCSGRVVECDLGAIPVDGSESVSVTVVLSEFLLSTDATVSADEPDFFTLGNADTCTVPVACIPTTVSTGENVRVEIQKNRPNPFNPETSISFSVSQKQAVMVTVYDVAGRRVAALTDKEYPAGTHTVNWDGRDSTGREAASGVYFLKIKTLGLEKSRKVTLIR